MNVLIAAEVYAQKLLIWQISRYVHFTTIKHNWKKKKGLA